MKLFATGGNHAGIQNGELLHCLSRDCVAQGAGLKPEQEGGVIK